MFSISKNTKAEWDLDATEFAEKLKSDPQAVIIDVRTRSEFSGGHLPKARNIDVMGGDFASKVASLKSDKTYYVYCRSGNRSKTAVKFMEQKGLKAYNLSGGIITWKGKIEQ